MRRGWRSTPTSRSLGARGSRRSHSSERAAGLSFEVIPAIDIRGGRCVRLFHGDYAQETEYSEDPAAVAREWEAQGAPRLHVVDLDGAREGHPVNRSGGGSHL